MGFLWAIFLKIFLHFFTSFLLLGAMVNSIHRATNDWMPNFDNMRHANSVWLVCTSRTVWFLEQVVKGEGLMDYNEVFVSCLARLKTRVYTAWLEVFVLEWCEPNALTWRTSVEIRRNRISYRKCHLGIYHSLFKTLSLVCNKINVLWWCSVVGNKYLWI